MNITEWTMSSYKHGGLRNFFDLWRLTACGLVQFAPIDELRNRIWIQRSRGDPCESVGKQGSHYWLEYADLEALPDYSSPFDISCEAAGTWSGTSSSVLSSSSSSSSTGEGGKVVIGGRHFVPRGVYVEDLSEAKKLSDYCSTDVKELLIRNGLLSSYDRFIDTLLQSKKDQELGKKLAFSGHLDLTLTSSKKSLSPAESASHCANSGLTRGSPIGDLSLLRMLWLQPTSPQYDVSNLNEDMELDIGRTKLLFPVRSCHGESSRPKGCYGENTGCRA